MAEKEVTRDFSDEQLDGIEGRSVKLLSAIGRTPIIQVSLQPVGFDAAELQLGWSLVHACGNFVEGSKDAKVDPEIAGAAKELNELDEPLVTRVDAVLTRLYPGLRDAVLKNVDPVDGPEAVVVIKNLLTNIDNVEKTAEGKAFVKVLAKRGLDATERARLKKLVAKAQELTKLRPPVDDAKHREALVALKIWFDDWAATAKTVIKRRDLLIRMGLASPRAKGGGTPK